MLNFTKNAVDRIKVLLERQSDQGDCFRVGLEPGGCAGYSYIFAVDKQKDTDAMVQLDGFKVILDINSAKLLDGSEIDYVDNDYGAMFKVSSPQAQGGCGCGSSVEF